MKQKNVIIILSVILAVTLLAAGGALWYFTYQSAIEEEKLTQIIGELDGEKVRLEGEVQKSNQINVELAEQLKLGAEDYMNQIDLLENELLVNQSYAEKLKSELDKRRIENGIDIIYYNTKFSELEKYIINNTPLLRIDLTEQELDEAKKRAEETDEDPDDVSDHRWVEKADYEKAAREKLDKELDEQLNEQLEQSVKQRLKQQISSGLMLDGILEKTGSEARVPEIAVYYKNLANGYIYTYNADEIFDGASVMKAPYITAVLDALTMYENGEIETKDGDKFYDPELIDEMFDISEKIVLDHETMDRDGSGELKDKPNGTELTYEELFTLALKKSDNIAFGLIKKKFTNRWYYDFVRSHGGRSPLTYEMNLTAREAGSMFESIYNFTVINQKYGELVRNSLESSSHTVLSKSVLGSRSIHKYGWDKNAYHDAALVYGEHPYVVVVFTDLDCGGKVVDEYIRGIFKRIDTIHNEMN